jgi:hypothetical protein
MQKYAACASVYKTITLNKKGEIKMNHVRVTTINGHEVEITHEEAMRIANELAMPGGDDFHQKVKERNQKYLEKAEKNISDIGARYGFHNIETESDLKELLAHMLDVDQDVADILVEIIEQRIGTHHKKIYSA